MDKKYICQNEKCTHHNSTFPNGCMKAKIMLDGNGKCVYCKAGMMNKDDIIHELKQRQRESKTRVENPASASEENYYLGKMVAYQEVKGIIKAVE